MSWIMSIWNTNADCQVVRDILIYMTQWEYTLQMTLILMFVYHLQVQKLELQYKSSLSRFDRDHRTGAS